MKETDVNQNEDGGSSFVHRLVKRVRGLAVGLELNLRQLIGLNEPEGKLVSDAQSFWKDAAAPAFKENSHWRGQGVFANDELWLGLGRRHLLLYRDFAAVVGQVSPLQSIVEWGCGGGMNAVHFAAEGKDYFGVDISPESLDECQRQAASAGFDNFRPVLIDSSCPEAAVHAIEGPCDLFLSTYVFELLPTPEYGLRVLAIAHKLLSDRGIAMIQIKYPGTRRRHSTRRWAYERNLNWHATYEIEEFWLKAQACGFIPRMVSLVPLDPEINDRNYAYFMLTKAPAEDPPPQG
jgi:SAM-dependent methyltransferase